MTTPQAHQATLDELLRAQEPESARVMMDRAIEWIRSNPGPFAALESWAITTARNGQRVSVRDYFPTLRAMPEVIGRPPLKLANALSAPLGRILVAWHPEIEPYVPRSRSKTDGIIIPDRDQVVVRRAAGW